LAELSRLGIDPAKIPPVDVGIITSAYGPESALDDTLAIVGKQPEAA
jgi:hypothetical protein